MSKKFISILLILAIISIILISCGNSAEKDETEDDIKPSEGLPAEDTTELIVNANTVLDTLPDDDFNQYEFKIWSSNWANAQLEIRQVPEEAENGEPINDALYKRDRLVEDKYNIKLKYTLLTDVTEMLNKSKKSLLAGDDIFEFICGDMMNVTKGLAQAGLVVDFNKMPFVDLSREWWSKNAKRDLTINGKFYYPTGDITPRFLLSPYMLLFNKNLFTNNGLEYPYKSILDGTWDLDKFISLLKGYTKDLNNDEKFTEADAYGLAAEGMTPYAFMLASGEGLTKIVDGNPVLNIESEKVLNITQKLASFMGDPQYVYCTSNLDMAYVEVPIFKEDRALFVAQTGTNLSMFRDMESDFGIIPIPKYDIKQEDYYSFCQAWGAVAICVPLLNSNLDRTGKVIEALAATGKYTSTPASYEVTLKKKYSRDGESEAMLDIIYKNASYDYTYIYNFGTLYTNYRSAIYKNQSVVSMFEKYKDKAQSELTTLIENFGKN